MAAVREHTQKKKDLGYPGCYSGTKLISPSINSGPNRA